MRRKSLKPVLRALTCLCVCGVFVSMSLIVSYVGQIDEYEYVKGSNPVPTDTSVFAALYYAVHAVPLLPLIGILVFFGVGALVLSLIHI